MQLKECGVCRYAAAELKWLGITAAMLDGVASATFHSLSGRDRALAATLISGSHTSFLIAFWILIPSTTCIGLVG